MAKARGFTTGRVSGSRGSKTQPKGTRTAGQAADVKAAFRGANAQLSKLSGVSNG